ncbi:MAG: hypothetical protein AB7T06_39785 [Kofleriaceae bacterium]
MPNTATSLATVTLAEPTMRLTLRGIAWTDVAIGDRVVCECRGFTAPGVIAVGPDDAVLVALEAELGPGNVRVRRPRVGVAA